MSRVTIPDIAVRAGVSTATVDRVLNGRAGVRAANRFAVFQAARDLGYLPSEGMVVLPSKPAHLRFLIPFDRAEFMHEVSLAIRDFARDLPLVASAEVTEIDGIGPDALVTALDALPPETDGVGLLTTDHPRSRAAIERLCAAGLGVVTIASDVPGTPRAAYVGVRDRAGGRTAARILGLLTGGTAGQIAVFLGSHAFHGHRERQEGFHEVMARDFPRLRMIEGIEVGEDGDRTEAAMARLLRNIPDLVGVYCAGAGRSGVVAALDRAAREAPRPRVVMHDLTRSSRIWLARGVVDALIDQNARLVGEQSVIRLLGAIASPAPFLPVKEIEPRIILRENLPETI